MKLYKSGVIIIVNVITKEIKADNTLVDFKCGL